MQLLSLLLRGRVFNGIEEKIYYNCTSNNRHETKLLQSNPVKRTILFFFHILGSKINMWSPVFMTQLSRWKQLGGFENPWLLPQIIRTLFRNDELSLPTWPIFFSSSSSRLSLLPVPSSNCQGFSCTAKHFSQKNGTRLLPSCLLSSDVDFCLLFLPRNLPKRLFFASVPFGCPFLPPQYDKVGLDTHNPSSSLGVFLGGGGEEGGKEGKLWQLLPNLACKMPVGWLAFEWDSRKVRPAGWHVCHTIGHVTWTHHPAGKQGEGEWRVSQTFFSLFFRQRERGLLVWSALFFLRHHKSLLRNKSPGREEIKGRGGQGRRVARDEGGGRKQKEVLLSGAKRTKEGGREGFPPFWGAAEKASFSLLFFASLP